ncbi:MAG: FAD-dependent oxidoreductase [Thermodesulfobacteriota bacterium]
MEKKLACYICTGCGLGDALNIEALRKVAAKEYKVPVCQTHPQLCAPEGVEIIKKDIQDQGVNTIVVAACSGRVMYDVFNFPGSILDRVNLREQVVWCLAPNEELKDPKEDIQMAAEDYLRMGLTKVKKMELPEGYFPDQEQSKDILVVGGGVTGLTAALEVAKAGYKCHLVEKEKELGGFQRKVRRQVTFPYKGLVDNDLPALVKAVKENGNITVHPGVSVARTDGGPTIFTVYLNDGPLPEPEKPAAEGEPATEAKAATCFKVGAIIEAPGFKPYEPGKLPERFGYGISEKVVTNFQFEEENLGAEKHDNVAFIQCAGSRDPEHLPYCSTVCCLASLKQAVQVKETNPEANVFVVYRELRTPGQAEDFYRAAQEKGVTFVRCQEPKVRKTWAGPLVVEGVDELLSEEIEIPGLDLVVLATGMVPATGFGPDVKKKEAETQKVEEKKPSDALPVPVDVIYGSKVLNLAYRQGPELPDLKYGFPDSHFVCFPFESRRTGVYPAGCTRRPMGLAAAYEDAAGAAMKAIQAVEMISKGMAVHPRAGDLSYPMINLQRCTQCRRCTDECPFGALNEDEKSNPLAVPTRCRRCGVCMGACPERIISFQNYSVDMIGSMIKDIEMPEEDEEKPRVLLLACENDSYPALDMCGQRGFKYSPYVRIVPLRCLGSINLVWIADALSKGYDGVLLFGCKHGDDYQCHFIRGSELANIRMSKISETLTRLALEPERIRVEEIAITDWERIPGIITEFMETIEEVGPNPFKSL